MTALALRLLGAARLRLRRHVPWLVRPLGAAYRRAIPALHRRLDARLRRTAERAVVAELRRTIDDGARAGHLSPAVATRLRDHARRLESAAGAG